MYLCENLPRQEIVFVSNNSALPNAIPESSLAYDLPNANTASLIYIPKINYSEYRDQITCTLPYGLFEITLDDEKLNHLADTLHGMQLFVEQKYKYEGYQLVIESEGSNTNLMIHGCGNKGRRGELRMPQGSNGKVKFEKSFQEQTSSLSPSFKATVKTWNDFLADNGFSGCYIVCSKSNKPLLIPHEMCPHWFSNELDESTRNNLLKATACLLDAFQKDHINWPYGRINSSKDRFCVVFHIASAGAQLLDQLHIHL